MAPRFSLPDATGRLHRLEDYRGQKVALYFYPKDDTPGCTAQACNLRDNWEALQKAGIVVLGISTDSERSHNKFAQKFSLPFPLLADTEKEAVQAYGVWGEKTFMGRTFTGTHRKTFLISAEGALISVIEKVDTKDHAAQILAGFGLTAPPGADRVS